MGNHKVLLIPSDYMGKQKSLRKRFVGVLFYGRIWKAISRLQFTLIQRPLPYCRWLLLCCLIPSALINFNTSGFHSRYWQWVLAFITYVSRSLLMVFGWFSAYFRISWTENSSGVSMNIINAAVKQKALVLLIFWIAMEITAYLKYHSCIWE